MKRITIERYPNPDELGCSGLIEGEADTGNRWALWLDGDGQPYVYWATREPDGAVTGEPVLLAGCGTPTTEV